MQLVFLDLLSKTKADAVSELSQILSLPQDTALFGQLQQTVSFLYTEWIDLKLKANTPNTLCFQIGCWSPDNFTVVDCFSNSQSELCGWEATFEKWTSTKKNKPTKTCLFSVANMPLYWYDGRSLVPSKYRPWISVEFRLSRDHSIASFFISNTDSVVYDCCDCLDKQATCLDDILVEMGEGGDKQPNANRMITSCAPLLLQTKQRQEKELEMECFFGKRSEAKESKKSQHWKHNSNSVQSTRKKTMKVHCRQQL